MPEKTVEIDGARSAEASGEYWVGLLLKYRLGMILDLEQEINVRLSGPNLAASEDDGFIVTRGVCEGISWSRREIITGERVRTAGSGQRVGIPLWANGFWALASECDRGGAMALWLVMTSPEQIISPFIVKTVLASFAAHHERWRKESEKE